MRSRPWFHLAVTAAGAALAGLALGLPLLRPREARGDFLGGHYALHEVYVGVPALVVLAGAALVWVAPRPRRRALGLRVSALLLAVLGGIALFDLGFALLYRGALWPHPWLDFAHVPRADNEPDPELGFRRRPHAAFSGYVAEVGREVSYRVDAQGFRNPDGIERAELVFVGDSYTEAAQVDAADTFVARVAARTGRTAVNLGRGAYGPQQQRIVIGRHALGYRPRVLVWQLFDGNDLGDAEQFEAWRAGRLGTAPLLRRYLDNSLFRPLLDATAVTRRGDFALLLGDDGSRLPITVRYRWMPEQTVERAAGWAATAAALRDGIAACREQGVEVLVLVVPVLARVLRERLGFADPAEAARYTPPDPEPLRDLGTAVAGLCAGLGAGCIDLYPDFRAAAAERAEGLFIPRDEHLDRRGHEVVADAVVRWLEQRGLGGR